MSFFLLNLLFSAFFFCIILSKSFPPTSSLSSSSLLGPSSSELSAVTLLASLATLFETLFSAWTVKSLSSSSESLISSPRFCVGTFPSLSSSSESLSIFPFCTTLLFFDCLFTGDKDLEFERDLEDIHLEDLDLDLDGDIDLDWDLDLGIE